VSASVRSCGAATGSSASSRRDASALGDDERERKDGGGDAGGHCWAPPCAVTGESSWSMPATCGLQSVPSGCGSDRGSSQVQVQVQVQVQAHAALDALRRQRTRS
jgi:hypothetical protein